jgi:sulfide:quinone oxidoreductase
VAAFARGDFYAEPNPTIRLRKPARFWHWGKIYFEKWWLRHWFS